MERYAEFTLGKMRASGVTAEQIAARAREMAEFSESYRNPW